MKSLAEIIFLFLMCFPAFLTGCKQIAYQPFEIDQLSTYKDAIQLSFETSKGKQVAFYIPPKTNAKSTPNPLVIIYPGIGARALDWLPFVENAPGTTAGYLLLDYPGRGFSEGLMRPGHLPQTSLGALEALEKQLDIDQNTLYENICLCGHSFGCAAALQFAQEILVKRIVLFAPFTTLHKAMFKMMGPFAYLNPDSMDNRQMIRDLLSRNHPPKITIIHGTRDETIPVEMGRALAAIGDQNITYYEIPEATHMSIIEKNRQIAYDALFTGHQ